MLAAIGRRVQRALQKSTVSLFKRNSTLVNKSRNIWKYKTTRRSFTSLFPKDVSEEKETGKIKFPENVDFEIAKNGFDQFSKRAKYMVELYDTKALVCLESGDPQGALNMSNKSIALLQLPDSYALRAFALSFLGQAEEALKDFKTVVDGMSELSKRNVWSTFTRLAQASKEYHTGALNVMKRAIQIFPNDEHVAEAFDNLADALSTDTQERLKYYLQAADCEPKNVVAWTYAISLDPKNAHRYVTQALLHNPSSYEVIWSTITKVSMEQEDRTRALNAADNAKPFWYQRPSLIGPCPDVAYSPERRELYDRDRIEHPLFEVQYVAAQWFYLTDQQGQYERALERIDEVISGSSNVTPEHYSLKAMIHGQLKQYDKELQAYLQHFKMQKDPVQTNQVFLIEHRFEEGLAHIDTHLQKDPHADRLWLQRADLLQRLGRYNEALEAVKKSSEASLALPLKGVILAQLKRTNEARQIAKFLIDEYKLVFYGMRILGEAYFQEGNFEETVKYFEKSLEDDSDVEPYRYERYLHLARALESRGDVTRALEMYALVHHINPFEPISAERLKQLDGK